MGFKQRFEGGEIRTVTDGFWQGVPEIFSIFFPNYVFTYMV